MNRAGTVRKILPVLVPVVTAIAVAIVYIRLSCVDGATLCGNVSQMINETTVKQSVFLEVLSLFGF